MKPIYGLRDLENWETVTRALSPPIRLGVLGHPVAHSLSPQMQNAALEAREIPIQYARFEIAPNELKPALELMRELEFVGCNLTLPHKTIDLTDEIEARTLQVRAINTIAFRPQGSTGWNTDGPGFLRAIKEVFQVELCDLRVLILGAGGAGRAVAWECALQGCRRLVLANRDFQKALNVTRAIDDSVRRQITTPWLQAIPWENAALRGELAETDLLVHATSLGLHASDPSPVPPELLRPGLMVYDLNYGLELTPLLVAAEAAGARGANGLAMLLHQGALAFEHWFDQPVPVEAMRDALQT